MSLCTPPREAGRAVSSWVPTRLAGRWRGEEIEGSVERNASRPSWLFGGYEEASSAYAPISAGAEDDGSSISMSSSEMVLVGFRGRSDAVLVSSG